MLMRLSEHPRVFMRWLVIGPCHDRLADDVLQSYLADGFGEGEHRRRRLHGVEERGSALPVR